MATDPARLYTLLMNTGLQTKDNPTYQVIHDLIGHIISVNKSVSSSSSASGNVGQQGIQGIQGLPGLDGISGDSSSDSFTNPIFPIPIPPLFGGTGLNSFTIGDMLYADTASSLAKLAMVGGGSVLVSTSGPGAPRWVTAVTLGALGSPDTGQFTLNGRQTITHTQTDIAEFSLNINATLPSVTTAVRTGLNFSVTTAGSSASGQQGCVFTFAAGYTGAGVCTGFIANTNIASTGFVVAQKAHANGVSAVNIGINAYVGNGTQNIAIFAGLGDTDGSTFSSGVSGCLVGTNGTTGSNLIDLYNNVTSAFRVSGAGVLTTASSIISNGGNIQSAAAAFITWNGRTALSSASDGVMNVTKQSTTVGFAFDATTDGVCQVRTRASAADAAITHAAYTHSGAEIDKTYQIYAPATLATVTMNAGQSRAVLNPAGTIAVLTVTLPPTPTDGQIAGISFTQIVSALTVNAPGGATVSSAPTSAAVDTNYRFIYQASSTTWFPAS